MYVRKSLPLVYIHYLAGHSLLIGSIELSGNCYDLLIPLMRLMKLMYVAVLLKYMVVGMHLRLHFAIQ